LKEFFNALLTIKRVHRLDAPALPRLAMGNHLLDILTTPAVEAAQVANGSRATYARLAASAAKDRTLSDDEMSFIAERDCLYMATVSANGWPYIQHRGGPQGFLTVLDSQTLAFADYRGNRQYLSLGNIAGNDRVALILMDYAQRRRLKLLGRASIRGGDEDLELAARVIASTYHARVERIFVITIEAYDWNCPQHITPRFSETELQPLHARLEALEAENQRLRALIDPAHETARCE
jgi:uncharacterized protein